MRIKKEFPFTVREIENCYIPMPDGCRLAARIWLPESAEYTPVPAIIEYIPYRKRDGTRRRDEPMHRYFAGHGYAAVRIDLRGAGDSDGLLLDEYLVQEQRDGVEAIDWIARQPWCNGRVGMMGKSWGGFNSLQIAALQPAALKAVIAVCATDDRYADDAHYMGGCLLNENLLWGSMLFTLNALPPDPALVGEKWKQMWMERLENTPLYPEIWLRHPRRDAYWKHGSVSEDYSRITCPVYAISGWADGYTNAVPRLLAGLKSPRKGLVGPWAHVYPHTGVPGPAIGFLQEALRWWDHWLQGQDTGLMEEPMFRAWMQEGVPPKSTYSERPGRWVAEPLWPSPHIVPKKFRLFKGELREARAGDEQSPLAALTFHSPQTIGLAAGSWCGFGIEGEMPGDQQEDDGKSLIFDAEPATARLEFLGAPELELDLAVDQPRAFLVARLNDVGPSGASTRLSYGVLNLTHCNSHEFPAPLVPGKRYRIRMKLNDMGYALAPGHRLRLALSTSYWPLVWPSPVPVVLTVFPAGSSLTLPVRPPRKEDDDLPPFEPPESAPLPKFTDIDPGGIRRTARRDLASEELVFTTVIDREADGEPSMERLEEIGLEVGHGITEKFTIRENDPLAARVEIDHTVQFRRAQWQPRVETTLVFFATADTFCLEAHMTACEGGARIFEKSWQRHVPRDLV